MRNRTPSGRFFRFLGGDKYLQKKEEEKERERQGGTSSGPGSATLQRQDSAGAMRHRVNSFSLTPQLSSSSKRQGVSLGAFASSSDNGHHSVNNRGAKMAAPSATSGDASAPHPHHHGLGSPLKKMAGGLFHHSSGKEKGATGGNSSKGGSSQQQLPPMTLMSPLTRVSEAGQRPCVTGDNTHYMEISCTRLFFPTIGDTIALPTGTAAPSPSHSAADTPLSSNRSLVSPVSAFTDPTQRSLFSGGGGGGHLGGNGAHSSSALPSYFTAFDVENVVHLRAALGKTSGLSGPSAGIGFALDGSSRSSGTVTPNRKRGATGATSSAGSPRSPQQLTKKSTTSSGTFENTSGLIKAAAAAAAASNNNTNAPNLTGHPLILYKVRSSAAYAFSCAPCYGMLQRYAGDTINVIGGGGGGGGGGLSFEDAEGGVGGKDFGFAGVLAQIERASERLSVTIRNPNPMADIGASPDLPAPFVTRPIEKIRIEFVVVLDMPTKDEVGNVIRTSAVKACQLRSSDGTGIPPTALIGGRRRTNTNADGGSGAGKGGADEDGAAMPVASFDNPASMLKSIQPVLAMLYEELKEKVPPSERGAAGDGSDAAANGATGGQRSARAASAPRRSTSAPRSRASSAARHGNAGAANPFAGLRGPLLTFGADMAGPSSSSQQPTSPVVKIGHADLTCFMGCGEELAAYLPARARRDAMFVSYAATGGVSGEAAAGGDGISGAALTDEAFEKRYVISSGGAPGAPPSALAHPLPIPFGAAITLRNMATSGRQGKGSRSPAPALANGSFGGAPPPGSVDTMGGPMSTLSGHSGTTAPPTPHHRVRGSGNAAVSEGSAQISSFHAVPSDEPQTADNSKAASDGGSTQKKRRGVFAPKVPLVVVLFLVVFVYSFVYCWRRLSSREAAVEGVL